MMFVPNYKPYVYIKGNDPVLDEEFERAKAFGKVRPGQTAIFWKSGFRWYQIALDQVQRIFRRIEVVHGKLCCGGHSFVIEWLVLVLKDETEVVLHIGDDVKAKAEALLQELKDTHPEMKYGKVYE